LQHAATKHIIWTASNQNSTFFESTSFARQTIKKVTTLTATKSQSNNNVNLSLAAKVESNKQKKVKIPSIGLSKITGMVITELA
jgi:hypothetical protein